MSDGHRTVLAYKRKRVTSNFLCDYCDKSYKTVLAYIVISLYLLAGSVYAQSPVIPTPPPIVVGEVEVTPIQMGGDMEVSNVSLFTVSPHTIAFEFEETSIDEKHIEIGDYSLTVLTHLYSLNFWFLGINIANILIGIMGARLLWGILLT